MFRIFFLTLCIGLTTHNVQAAGNQKTETVTTLGPVQTGQPMPTFVGYDLNGEMLRWKNFIAEAPEPNRGVIVSVFASWCGPCKIGLKHIDTVLERNPGVRLLLVNLQEDKPYGFRFVFLLVNLQEDKPKAVRFLKDIGISAPTILDQYGKISERMGVGRELPRTFLVGADGRVQQIYTVEGTDFEAVLERDIQSLGQ